MKKLNGVLCIVGLSLFLLLASSSFVFGNNGHGSDGGNSGKGKGTDLTHLSL